MVLGRFGQPAFRERVHQMKSRDLNAVLCGEALDFPSESSEAARSEFPSDLDLPYASLEFVFLAHNEAPRLAVGRMNPESSAP